jgi:hypothetical protein
MIWENGQTKKIEAIDVTSDYQSYSYKDKNGNQRKCAKMFYKLMVNNDIYRVEIRWKGNFSASPQFLCYLYDN